MSSDTTLKAAGQFYRLMMAKSGEQRLKMGCSMFDAAKKIAISGIRETKPDISSQKLKEEVFLRFYGQEFKASVRNKILNSLR